MQHSILETILCYNSSLDEESIDVDSSLLAVAGILSSLSPVWVPRLCLQCIAAPLGGASATVLTTPLDAIRARIQVREQRYSTQQHMC